MTFSEFVRLSVLSVGWQTATAPGVLVDMFKIFGKANDDGQEADQIEVIPMEAEPGPNAEAKHSSRLLIKDTSNLIGFRPPPKGIRTITCQADCGCYNGLLCDQQAEMVKQLLMKPVPGNIKPETSLMDGEYNSYQSPVPNAKMPSTDTVKEFVSQCHKLGNLGKKKDENKLAQQAYLTSQVLFKMDLSSPTVDNKVKNIVGPHH